MLRDVINNSESPIITLKNEITFLTDYLELEKMRLVDKLDFIIKSKSEDQNHKIPGMLIQPHIENAIKHGISKKINGGVVRIVSDFVGDHHVLLVQNTGQLNGVVNGDGFGIKSTQDRLNLLYQGKAKFDIKNLNGDIVESKVTMPVNPVLVIK